MNIFTITGEIVLKGKDLAQKQLVNLQGTTNNVTSQMEKSFKRLGNVVLAAFSVKALTNFARTLAETAATVHEEVAQFKAVLGDLEEEMTSRINKVSDQTGILETRLRKTATSVYAMMHSSGMETETALDNTERFLKFASDASAFYDKSMEEVQSDLQSFMRGVTRAGYSIGLYTSELQRNEKALEKYGVKYEKLNQEQRYDVMLDIIEQTYNLAGVTGQAERESEQWLNVTSNLTEAWKQFSAVLGETIMNALLKPIKKITDLLLKWKDKLQNLYDWWDEHADVVEEIKKKLIILATAIGLTIVALAGLTIIKNIIPLVKSLGALLAGNWVVIAIAGLSLLALNFIKLYNTNEEFRTNVQTTWNKFITWLTPVIESIQTLLQSVGNLFSTIWNSALKPILEGIKTRLSGLFSSILGNTPTLQSIITGVVDGITGKINGFASLIEQAQPFLQPIFENIQGLFSDLGELISSVYNNVIKPIWDVLVSAVSNAWAYIQEHSEELQAIINGIVDTFRSIIQTLTALFNGDMQGVVDGLVNIFKNAFNAIYEAVKFTWGLVCSFFEPIIEAIGSWLDKAIVKIKEFGKLAWEAFSDAFSSIGEFISGIWDTIKEKFVALGTNIGNAVGNAMKSGVNSIIGLVEKTINGAIGFINGAIKIMNKVPLVNIPLINELNIPRLAKGGVVKDATLAEIGEAGDEAVIPLSDESALNAIANALGGALTDTFDFSSLGFNIKDFISNLVSEFTNSEFGKAIMKALGYTVPESGGGKDDGSGGGGTGTNTTNPSFWEKLKSTAKKFYDYIFDSNSLWDGKVSEIAAKIHDSLENIVNYVQSYVTPLFDAITELQNQQAEKEIENLEKELETIKATHEEAQEADNEYYAGRLQELFHMLDIGAMSYEDYTDAVQKLDDDVQANKNERDKEEEEKQNELLTKKDELAKKQFEAEKRTSIAMVWVNSALAVMKAFSELGPIGGAVASALILATAGVQTATIAQQEYTPLLAQGGVVNHATNAIIGEDGAEAVVPLEKNLGWVNGLANALEPAINANNIDYTPQIVTISEQIEEVRSILANFLPLLTEQNFVLDGATIARKMTPYLDGTLGRQQRLAYRGI